MALLVAFGEGRSESVQHLLTLMATAALVGQPLMKEISLRLESTGLAPVPTAGAGLPGLFTVTTSPTAVTEVTVHQSALPNDRDDHDNGGDWAFWRPRR